jgi:UDP-glucose 4-epimerase
MKVLITGGSGFIGQHAVGRLRREGHGVRNYDLAAENPAERGDLRDRVQLARTFEEFRPEVVIHLAAIASVPRCEEAPAACIATNVAGTISVAELCARYSTHLIFGSSAAVYGSRIDTPTPVSFPLAPSNTYGASKWAGEMAIRAIAPRASVFRIFNVYGERCRTSYVIPDVIRKVRSANGSIELAGTGVERRDFVYVGDVVEAFSRAVRDRPTGTYNLGTGRTTVIRDLATRIAALLGRPDLHIKFLGPRPGDFPTNWADVTEGNVLPGWHAATPFDAGLERTVHSYLPEAGPAPGRGAMSK